MAAKHGLISFALRGVSSPVTEIRDAVLDLSKDLLNKATPDELDAFAETVFFGGRVPISFLAGTVLTLLARESTLR